MKDKRLKSLCKSIQTAVKKSCKENITISFSGGIDSTLLALIAKNYCHTELITVGVNDSFDIKASKTAAEEIGLNPKIVEKEPEEMIKEAEEDPFDLGTVEEYNARTNKMSKAGLLAFHQYLRLDKNN